MLSNRLFRFIPMLVFMASMMITATPTHTVQACNPCDCPNDKRHNCQGGEFYAIYSKFDARGACYFDVYSIDSRARGTRVFRLTTAELSALPAKPQQNTQVKSVGKIAFYKLSSGEYQINAGPDNEGKVFVIIFTGCPATNITESTFMAPKL